jgi:hypothetical protein
MAANLPTTGSENSFYLEFDMPQSRTCRTAIADSFSSSFSFSFCIGRGWQQIYPQQVQRTLFIFSSTCRKAEHVEQLVCEDTNQGTTHSASAAADSFSFSFSFCNRREWQQITSHRVRVYWFVKTLVCEDTNQGTTHSFSTSSSFSFCTGRGWEQITPQRVQRTPFI